jgi:hypothetical protein
VVHSRVALLQGENIVHGIVPWALSRRSTKAFSHFRQEYTSIVHLPTGLLTGLL